MAMEEFLGLHELMLIKYLYEFHIKDSEKIVFGGFIRSYTMH